MEFTSRELAEIRAGKLEVFDNLSSRALLKRGPGVSISLSHYSLIEQHARDFVLSRKRRVRDPSVILGPLFISVSDPGGAKDISGKKTQVT